MNQCPYKWNMIEQEKTEEVTKAGIIIPDKAREKHRPARGKVVVAGEDNKFVKAGDKVLFSKENAFTDIVKDDEGNEYQYVFVKEEDICTLSR